MLDRMLVSARESFVQNTYKIVFIAVRQVNQAKINYPFFHSFHKRHVREILWQLKIARLGLYVLPMAIDNSPTPLSMSLQLVGNSRAKKAPESGVYSCIVNFLFNVA